MGDPHEMFAMVKEYSGVRVLALAHCRSNRRYLHPFDSAHTHLHTYTYTHAHTLDPAYTHTHLIQHTHTPS